MAAERGALRFVDRLVLVVAWLATCGVVWVFGYYVGRGTLDARPGYDDRPVRFPVTGEPPPVGAQAEAPSGVSFYEQLTSGSPPKPDSGTPSTTVPSQPPAPQATPPSTVVTAARTEPSTVPKTLTTTTSVPPKAPDAGTKPPPATRGAWTVQAAPTRDRGEAEALQASLKRRGYDASVVRVQRDGETWYRLRVGRYGSSEEATEIMRRLRQREGVPQAFVATE